MDLERWRSLGVDVAFDPERLAARFSAHGKAQLRESLTYLDAERVFQFFPRDPDGRLSLDEMVLLAPIDLVTALRAPNQAFLVAEGPTRRSSPQVVTLALRDETAINFEHRWDVARWLWDARETATTAATKWGAELDVDGLAPDRASATLAKLQGKKRLSDGERATLSVLLVHAGRWRDAIARYDITHDLDELPYKQCNHGGGIEPEKWDRAVDAGLRTIAPWRFAPTLQGRDELRLFMLPGQKTARKFSVFLGLHEQTRRPHLSVSATGSNARAPGVWFRLPPDLAQIVLGTTPARASAKGLSSTKTRTEQELLAQIAADPTDDAARRVYADLLTERGDLRGEFITLQMFGELDAAAAKHMRSLERANWRSWLGPLGRIVEDQRFERGFLAACTLGTTKTPFHAWTDTTTPRSLAELAAVRELELAKEFPETVARELLPKLPLVTTLVVSLPLFTELELHSPTLLLRVSDPYAAVDALSRAATTHRPSELCFVTPDRRELANTLRECLHHVTAIAPPLDRIAFESGSTRIVVRRDGDRRLSIIALSAATFALGNQAVLSTLAWALQTCAADAITRIELHVPVHARTVEYLRNECERFTRIEIVTA